MKKELRFAPVIRVSTEQQAKQGESLQTQTTQINQYVKSLKGVIPEHCWVYSGQEHATPDAERSKLDQLLRDSGKDLFDAVIVCDASRWSRDNLQNKRGLHVLRKHRIKFFVGTMEYDLFNPEHSFILGMSAEIGELQARQQTLKSITNRIERSRRGIPSSGNLPYARTFDKETNKWGLDAEKVKKIKWAAQRYLAGEGITSISKSLGMNLSNLWKILNHRSGTHWEVKFRADKLNIDETVMIEIPALLDDETIEMIKKQAIGNKTYHHGVLKNQYLLSRMVFCKTCGYTFNGQTNHGNRRYYRHPRTEGCPSKKWIPADQLENAVLLHLFNLFGDVKRIEEAIEKATPDAELTRVMHEEFEDLKERELRLEGEKNRLVVLAGKGLLSDEDIVKRMDEIRTNLQAVGGRKQHLENVLIHKPNPSSVKAKARLGHAIFKLVMKSKAAMFEMDYEAKRKLVEYALGGIDQQGSKLGVYIEETGHPQKPFRFEIRAILDNLVSSLLPMHKTQLAELLGLDENYQNIDEFLANSSFGCCSPGISPL